MNRIAITKMQNNSAKYAYVMLDQDRALIDFELFDSSEASLLDNIYIGRVENIVHNINSAFVKIGENQNCYLSLDNAKAPIYVRKNSKKDELCIGDEIIVQVIKDAVKTKDPVVSCDISYHGKHCVLTTGNKTVGVSKKIDNKFAEEISEAVKNTIDLDKYGIVIRTSAGKLSIQEIISDINTSVEGFESIIASGLHKTAFTSLFVSEPGYIMKLRSVDISNVEAIVTDIEDVHEALNNYFDEKAYLDKISLYEDSSISLSTLYNLNGQIEKLINNKVWLKSGANIIIEQLETLTFIDVNTAKNITKNNNVVFDINVEAAKEIARQLRLRNISGMIIIDFINMNSEEMQKMLINALKAELQKDSVKCSFIDITKLGLVELTRKKVRKSLKDSL